MVMRHDISDRVWLLLEAWPSGKRAGQSVHQCDLLDSSHRRSLACGDWHKGLWGARLVDEPDYKWLMIDGQLSQGCERCEQCDRSYLRSGCHSMPSICWRTRPTTRMPSVFRNRFPGLNRYGCHAIRTAWPRLPRC